MRSPHRTFTLLAVNWCFLFLGWLAPTAADEAPLIDDIYMMDMVVHFIDVGNGDAAVVELPDRSHEIIVDGGHSRLGWDFYEYASTLIDGVIELTVISHPDYDHWSGIKHRLYNDTQHVLTRVWDAGYNRDCKFLGKKAGSQARDGYLRFLKELTEDPSVILERPPRISHSVGEPTWQLDGVSIWVLRAEPSPVYSVDCPFTLNNSSIVFRLQYGDVSLLFTGDINGKRRSERPSVSSQFAEAQVLAIPDLRLLDVDVLKVPHHGSNSASTEQFVEAVSPRFAIISSSARYGLPTTSVVQLYERVLFENDDDEDSVEALLRTDVTENNQDGIDVFGDDHIVCGTNGAREDLLCTYAWRTQ